MNRRSTRAKTMSRRYSALLSRRITSAATDVGFLNDNDCITRLKKCYIKRVKRNMEGGPSRTSCFSTEMPWKIIHSSQQMLRETETQNIGFFNMNQDGAQQPLNQRPDFAQAKRECKRLPDEHLARTQEEYRTTPRSQQARQRKGQAFE